MYIYIYIYVYVYHNHEGTTTKEDQESLGEKEASRRNESGGAGVILVRAW